MEAYMNDMEAYPFPCGICGKNTHLTDDHVDVKISKPMIEHVELIFCAKCGSDEHTTNDHIIYRIEKHNINIIPDPICTKCLGDNHPRKYCDIYNGCINAENGYFEYLDQIYLAEKDRLMIDYCKYNPKAIAILNEFHTHSLDEQISFLFNHDYFPVEGMKPFWDIVYRQHSKESIESVKIKYFDSFI
jgi:hypothetical protein